MSKPEKITDPESSESWKKRAAMANAKGFRLLYAAMKCFELAEAAKKNAALKAKEAA